MPHSPFPQVPAPVPAAGEAGAAAPSEGTPALPAAGPAPAPTRASKPRATRKVPRKAAQRRKPVKASKAVRATTVRKTVKASKVRKAARPAPATRRSTAARKSPPRVPKHTTVAHKPARTAAPPKALRKKSEGGKSGGKGKPKKAKLIRDSFTMPEPEYGLFAAVKKRCLAKGLAVTKSEVLRAAIQEFAARNDAAVTRALGALEVLKKGRPPKDRS